MVRIGIVREVVGLGVFLGRAVTAVEEFSEVDAVAFSDLFEAEEGAVLVIG
jgi:hypothetical protein